MDFFEKTKAVKLKSHLDKYLAADDDQETVRQSRNGNSRKARWLVEVVDGGGTDIVRLKSCHGKYLTASNEPFLLGMTGHKVQQTTPENMRDMKIEWEPIRDGFQVKLKAYGGTYLRANGGTPPWRNSITHDKPMTGSSYNWILWEVEAVEVPEDEPLNEYLSILSSFSSVSDEISSLELGSPMSTHAGFNSPKIRPSTTPRKVNRELCTHSRSPDEYCTGRILAENPLPKSIAKLVPDSKNPLPKFIAKLVPGGIRSLELYTRTNLLSAGMCPGRLKVP